MTHRDQILALVRHGHSFANDETEKPADGYYYKLSGSDRSVGVTERGLQQCDRASALLAMLFPEENPIEQVWTSEYDRTDLSAGRIIQSLPYVPALRCDPRLNKREYGQFWNMTYLGVEKLHPDQFELYKGLGALKYRPPGGENYFDLFERTEEFVKDNLENSSGHQMIVGHSASLLALIRELEGLEDSEVVRQYHCVSIPNAYIVLYARKGPGDPFRRLSLFEAIATAGR